MASHTYASCAQPIDLQNTVETTAGPRRSDAILRYTEP